jgi:hypothetical protein
LRLAWLFGLSLGLGSLAAGCTSDLKLALEGKQCSAEGRCVDGYACDLRSNLCVLAGTLRDGGGLGGSSFGSGGDAGHGGRGNIGGASGRGASGGGSPGGTGGSGGNPGGGGAGGVGGAVEPNDPDGGADDVPDADGGCVPTTVYRDRDRDHFGVTLESRVACPNADWVTADGDCNDDDSRVFPGQTTFFPTGYASPSPAPAGVSFDYDCTSGEEPESARDAEVPTCGTLLGTGLGCSGSGFEPASPARSGVGVEPRCGSNVRVDCMLTGSSCDEVQSTLVQSEAFACR